MSNESTIKARLSFDIEFDPETTLSRMEDIASDTNRYLLGKFQCKVVDTKRVSVQVQDIPGVDDT